MAADLCDSFIPLEQLAAVVGMQVPATTAMVEILHVFAGYDYRAHGVGLDREGIITFATYSP